MKLFKNLYVAGGRLVADKSIKEIDDYPFGRDVVHRIRMLVEASTDLFVGDYPMEAPLCPLKGELDWIDEYHRREGIQYVHLPLPVEEIRAIAAALQDDECGGVEGRRSQCCNRLNMSMKGKVQGAAVETMLHADAFLGRVKAQDWRRALLWLTAANEAFTTALCAAHVALALAPAETSAGSRPSNRVSDRDFNARNTK